MTRPAEAAPGPAATICVSLQLVIDGADAPLKRSELLPCAVPKFEPVIVTERTGPPAVGASPVTTGAVYGVPADTATLSNPAFIKLLVVPDVTAGPIYTFCAM